MGLPDNRQSTAAPAADRDREPRRSSTNVPRLPAREFGRAIAGAHELGRAQWSAGGDQRPADLPLNAADAGPSCGGNELAVSI
jgi:hypothetical protein